jgi:hypothetical protein
MTKALPNSPLFETECYGESQILHSVQDLQNQREAGVRRSKSFVSFHLPQMTIIQ